MPRVVPHFVPTVTLEARTHTHNDADGHLGRYDGHGRAGHPGVHGLPGLPAHPHLRLDLYTLITIVKHFLWQKNLR